MLLDIGQSGKAAVTPVNSHPTDAHSINPTASRWTSQRISGVGARHPSKDLECCHSGQV